MKQQSMDLYRNLSRGHIRLMTLAINKPPNPDNTFPKNEEKRVLSTFMFHIRQQFLHIFRLEARKCQFIATKTSCFASA